MDDDFNTPEALAALQALARDLNIAKSSGESRRTERLGAELRRLGSLLGLLAHEPAAWLGTRSELTGGVPAETAAIDPAEIERLLQARVAARQGRNFAESDRIREELATHGVLLEDGPTGTTWRWK